jgi:dephospho-CoA kinase
VPTIASDAVVHRLISTDPEVRAELERRFGTTERPAIAAIVFEDREQLDWLERLLHPRVREQVERELAELDADVAVVEIPLLYETGADELYDAVVVVTAPEQVRAARARVPLAGRSDRLIPDDEKVRRADFAYVNDRGLDELDAFVGRVLEELRSSG